LPKDKKPSLWEYLRDQLGIDLRAIGHIKFAGGVVGKLTLIAVVAIIGIAAVCYKAFSIGPLPGLLFFCGGGLVAIILSVVLAYWAIVRTTDKHPEISAIEGMDLVALMLGLGAKGMDIVPEQKGVPKPAIDITSSTSEDIQK
jgi:hypothetical protein